MNIIKDFIFSQKILGMNARNLSYIKPYNKKKWIQIVDNKITFKKVLEKNDIPTPKLIGLIQDYSQLNEFDFTKLPKSFVLKPTNGFGGEGILVIFGEDKKGSSSGERIWVKGKGVKITESDLINHIKNILDGTYSRTNSPDIAFFEERIKITKQFKSIAYKGIPDIRVIVFNRVPVMAMLRMPTKKSDGKANLHQGGIGVGIDLANGITTNAIMDGNLIEYVPETKIILSGIKIPYWDKILEISVRTADATNMGYTGIDISLDRDEGPVVLEANARPGLAIQFANLAPLKERLEKIANLKIKTVKRAIQISKNLFGGEIEEEVEEITGKTLIGLKIKTNIFGLDERYSEVDTKVDTGADSSSVDATLIEELGFGSVFEEFRQLNLPNEVNEKNRFEINKLTDKVNLALKNNSSGYLKKVAIVKAGNGFSLRPYVQLKLKIENVYIVSTCSIVDRGHLKFKMLLGKKDMKNFIIDPTKR